MGDGPHRYANARPNRQAHEAAAIVAAFDPPHNPVERGGLGYHVRCVLTPL
jgi:hypothetical protein